MITGLFLVKFCTLAKKRLEKIGDFHSFSVNLKKKWKKSAKFQDQKIEKK